MNKRVFLDTNILVYSKDEASPFFGHVCEALKGLVLNKVDLWPGNVRELKAVVESAALRCSLGNSAKVTENHLESLLMDHDKPVEAKEDDVFRRLAETELKMVENALIRSGGKKGEPWELLGYHNRFSMLRRGRRIMSEHPELVERFPELKKSYS